MNEKILPVGHLTFDKDKVNVSSTQPASNAAVLDATVSATHVPHTARLLSVHQRELASRKICRPTLTTLLSYVYAHFHGSSCKALFQDV